MSQHLAECDRRARALNARTHYVYRAYDESGLLLYIGCTVNLSQRMNAHRKSSAWWQFVAAMDVLALPTRTSARAHEGQAIRSESSFFNRLPGNQLTSDASLEKELAAYFAAQSERAA